MRGPVLTIARQELRIAGTNRLAMLLSGIFLGMVLISGFIGWASHHTVTSVYGEALREGAASGPNPFSTQQPLDLIRNTVIYTILIGALSAILVGVQSAMHDRKAGVVDLLFSRPVTTRQYVAGKFLGMQYLLALILAAAGLLSWGTALFIRGAMLSPADTGALAAFFLLAWLFLVPFNMLGFIFGAGSRRETSALLAPILVWVLLVFVLPQLGTAAHPVSLLNPVPAQPASQGSFFAFNHRILQPVSPADRFKGASAGLLGFSPGGKHFETFDWTTLAIIAAAGFIAALLLIRSGRMRKPVRE